MQPVNRRKNIIPNRDSFCWRSFCPLLFLFSTPGSPSISQQSGSPHGAAGDWHTLLCGGGYKAEKAKLGDTSVCVLRAKMLTALPLMLHTLCRLWSQQSLPACPCLRRSLTHRRTVGAQKCPHKRQMCSFVESLCLHPWHPWLGC